MSDTIPSAPPVRAPGKSGWPRPVTLVLLSGLSLTGLLFAGISRLEQDKLELAFQQRAHVRLWALKEGVDNAIGSLRAVNQLFASHMEVSREEFRRFTQPTLAYYPYVQSASYLRFIDAAERPAFEARLRGFQAEARLTEMRDGVAVTAGERARYRVIEYLEPLQGNEMALGLDTLYPAYGEAVRQHAYDTGLPAAGQLVALVEGPEPRVGVVISMPVYRYGAELASLAQRRAAVIGETAIVLRPADMIAKVFEAAGLRPNQGMSLNVYAAAANGQREQPLYAAAEAPSGQGTLPRWLYPGRAAPLRQSFDVAGQSWRVAAAPGDEVLLSDHLASLSTLALGLLLTGLGAAYMRTLSLRNRVIQRHVEERTAQLKELNRELLLRERAIESSTNAVVITAAQPGNPTVYVNRAFERITGYGAAEILGRSPRLLHGDDTEQPGAVEVRSAIREQRDGHAILRNYRKDGTAFWNEIYISPVRDEQGTVTHYVSIQHDITAMKAYESELHHQSMHDALTGLPNRLLLQDRLRQTITHSARKRHSLWLVSLDLDRFKFTNSHLGHKGGDRLLQAVAQRLQQAVRPVDTVARIGGDEFALMLLPEHGTLTPRAEQVQRVLEALAAPLLLDEAEIFLSGSAGIAVYPADSADPGILMERADIAMYRAKEMGGNNYQFYTAALNEQLGERLLIEGALRQALERREFVLHYQPQVDIASGRIVGMEALVRWQHPELGMVAPNRFIPLAEETGLIVPLGAWVLRTACAQALAWQRLGKGELRVAVNVSARQMAEQDFVQSVAAALAETGLAPHCLELELTESQVMNDIEHAISVMHELKKLGVKLAIDDFGTGYSSLAHLKRFAIDVLKIDQTFVRDVTENADDAAIVMTIIALASNLKLEVISEGVETRQQLDFLRQHGCQQMQGYYFSRPVPAADFLAVLEAHEARQAAERGAQADRMLGQAI
ncbi:EAL domain-containing protein [Massilia sp. BJB1822]|uniref:bifunctional diguanylate cyclase/phosphodiesterase n=1 Tax=Massilia sp. BJB1822 TaxID=2744470 RepID=UPI0015941F7F|nr:EAL domain-containing protein [Massilia sp. BJB1822]NVE01584.1 EAL domain-containing protein [Massilia sp. BJB1822]